MRTLSLAVLTAFCVLQVAMARTRHRWITQERLDYIEQRRLALHDPVGPLVPQQIHLTYGQDVGSSMNVAWTTRNQTACSAAQAFVQTPTGARLNFTGVIVPWDVPSEFLYSVNMTGLAPRTTYTYVQDALPRSSRPGAPGREGRSGLGRWGGGSGGEAVGRRWGRMCGPGNLVS
jgi:Purple acid Phosphatase, N-terminal domain